MPEHGRPERIPTRTREGPRLRGRGVPEAVQADEWPINQLAGEPPVAW
jgi:hypothetical protein